MANTYTQIYIHIVFTVRHREALISSAWKERLNKYITGIVQNQGHKLIAVNTVPDHIHIFVGLKPDAAISDLVRDVKRDSTNFINDEIRCRYRFHMRCNTTNDMLLTDKNHQTVELLRSSRNSL